MHIVCLKCLVAGVAFVAIASYILLGVMFRRLRGYHHGTQVRLGIFTSLSVASLPLSWGAVLVWMGTHVIDGMPVLWFVIPFVVCFCGAIIGSGLDFHADEIDRLHKHTVAKGV
jgi:hypothetical protein